MQNSPLRFAALFQDHMILQQNAHVQIWGWATPNAAITVSANWSPSAHAQTTADSTGKWSLSLPTPTATPNQSGHSLSLSDATGQTKTLTDILLGDIWLLSGQSNMEQPLAGWLDSEPPAVVENSAEEIAQANLPQLRFLIVGRKNATAPQPEITPNPDLADWQTCTPQTIPLFSAIGYFFGKELLNKSAVPVGLIQAAWGGSSCEAWTASPDLATVDGFSPNTTYQPESPEDKTTPSIVFNGMLAPIIPFTFKGILWYQGETNVGRHQQLRQLFPAMIQGWREKFAQPDLPFYFAHLAPWNGYTAHDLPEFWHAQSAALTLPHTALVVTIDAGDPLNVHPKYKKPIGQRFAHLALNPNLTQSGPAYLSHSIKDNTLTLHFQTPNNSLVLKPSRVSSFELAGDNNAFHPAEAQIQNNSVHLTSHAVPHPTQARYAWSPDSTPSLFDTSGQPAAPIRSKAALETRSQ